MGNQASALGDEPNSNIAQKNLHHFDHNFKAELHTASGSFFGNIFGLCAMEARPIEMICKG